MNQGILNSWIILRKYGFILDLTQGSPTYGRTIFLHISNWKHDGIPKIGDIILFDLGPGIKGRRFQALNAHLAISQAVPESLPVPPVTADAVEAGV